MSASPLSVVVLAAGQGTRMRSNLPKVLHPLAGRPLVEHVLSTAAALSPQRTVAVIGHGGAQVREACAHLAGIEWVEQQEQLGTGHAVAQALPALPDRGLVLILYGDVPLIGADTLQRLLAAAGPQQLALLTANLDDPTGYGRIIRDERGRVLRIVEEKDASELERHVHEVNTGILAAPATPLRRWLAALGNDNAQGEYYLTDVIAMAAAAEHAVHTAHPAHLDEVLGVNDPVQLARLERIHQRRQAEALMRAGVRVMDPARLDIRGRVRAGRDVVLDVGVVLEGEVELADGVYIGPHCVLRDSVLEAGTQVQAMSVIDSARCGPDSRIGPFARIRPGTALAAGAHVGNFVEIKNSSIGAGSKVNHLSYVGDSSVGARVNIGAGTITCNYDGVNKHRTVIGDDAFIGSDSQLVAPVTVGAGATIGAGSTITRDAPGAELSLSRSKQVTVPGWQRPKKR